MLEKAKMTPKEIAAHMQEEEEKTRCNPKGDRESRRGKRLAAIQEQEEEDNAEALALSRLKRTKEAGLSGTKQESQLTLLGYFDMLERQIRSMKVVAEIEEETKLNLQVQVSSLKILTTTHTNKIQELSFALTIRESLIKQEHQKNKVVYTHRIWNCKRSWT